MSILFGPLATDTPWPDAAGSRLVSVAEYNELSRCRLELIAASFWLTAESIPADSKLDLVASCVRRGLGLEVDR